MACDLDAVAADTFQHTDLQRLDIFCLRISVELKFYAGQIRNMRANFEDELSVPKQENKFISL
jgi:hypothetical protein